MKLSKLLKKTFLKEGVYDATNFKVVFLFGGPGSGKSFINSIVTAGHGYKTVNSDTFFNLLLKKNNVSSDFTGGLSDEQAKLRNQAQQKKDNYINRLTANRSGYIIDGTGRLFNEVKKIYDNLQSLGYDCFAVLVNTSLDIAQQRNHERLATGERRLDPEVVNDIWQSVQDNIPKFKSLFGKNFIEIKNDEFVNDKNIFSGVWKQIMKFTRAKITNPIAKQWEKNQLQKRKSSHKTW